MFLDKYLDDLRLKILYTNYNEDYLNSLEESSFEEVYTLLKEKGFYYTNDIILNYLELFTIDKKYVEKSLNEISSLIKENYIEYLGKNMSLFDKVISLAINYSK